jgi:hypothetical protein
MGVPTADAARRTFYAQLLDQQTTNIVIRVELCLSNKQSPKRSVGTVQLSRSITAEYDQVNHFSCLMVYSLRECFRPAL